MNNPRVVVKPGVSRRDRALLRACEDWRGWSMTLAVIACLIAVFALGAVAVAPSYTAVTLSPLVIAMVMVITFFVLNVMWPLYRRSKLIARAEAVILTAPYDQRYDEQMLHIITKKPEEQSIQLQILLVNALCIILKEQTTIARAHLEQGDGWEKEVLKASSRQETMWRSYLKMVDSVADRKE